MLKIFRDHANEYAFRISATSYDIDGSRFMKGCHVRIVHENFVLSEVRGPYTMRGAIVQDAFRYAIAQMAELGID